MLFFLVGACGGHGGSGTPDGGGARDASTDAATPPEVDAAAPADATPDAGAPEVPALLSETGLYSSGEVLADGVREYTLVHPLWTDGATKRRWIKLPPESTIDTSDMNFWVYPVGTKIWKEFTRGGVRVETRFLWKKGPDLSDWVAVAYLWNDQQSDAVAAPDGVPNAKGTPHDVPSAVTCRECHGRQPDFVLGFAAVALDHTEPGLNLTELVEESLLSDPPPSGEPHFPVPGDATEQAALSYLHINCGGCHHRESPLMGTTSLDLRLYPDSIATVEDTAAYKSAVGQASSLLFKGEQINLIEPGDHADSNIWRRMSATDSYRMPPVGTEDVDTTGVAAVQAWIDSL